MKTSHWIAPALALVLVLTGGTGAAVAGTSRPAGRDAAQFRLNPRHNIAPPRAVFGSACRHHPHGRRCTRIMVRALNHARSVLNQPRYHLPARFASLRSRDQLLVVTNLDRRLYGRARIRGINPRLNRSAHRGARRKRDPSFVFRVNGARLRAGGSNWAGGTAPMNNPLFPYYEWMYDDGFGGSNVDCPHRGAPGCWGHRDNVLVRVPRGSQVEIGVGFARPNRLFSWAELIEAFAARATIPCLPTVTGLSRHSGPRRGSRLAVHGFGFVQVRKVTVLGKRARIIRRGSWTLRIRAPRHTPGRGFVRVITASGKSGKTRTAAYRYAA